LNILVTYDVNTETEAGQKRLRKVAMMGSRDRAVEAYGVDRYIDFNEPLIM
jgi:CRISPR/Cas system-associated endoribonuclease Cas2